MLQIDLINKLYEFCRDDIFLSGNIKIFIDRIWWLAQCMMSEKPFDILHIGCGEGFLTNELKKITSQFGKTIVGVEDFDKKGLNIDSFFSNVRGAYYGIECYNGTIMDQKVLENLSQFNFGFILVQDISKFRDIKLIINKLYSCYNCIICLDGYRFDKDSSYVKHAIGQIKHDKWRIMESPETFREVYLVCSKD